MLPLNVDEMGEMDVSEDGFNGSFKRELINLVLLAFGNIL